MIDPILFPNPVQVPVSRPAGQQKPSGPAGNGSSFARVLDEKLPTREVTFSNHAQERLRSRGITLSATDLARLEGAVDSVASKGGNDSLVLMGDAALVVSIKNRTVVTAMDRNALHGNVFTNIDSAVLIG